MRKRAPYIIHMPGKAWQRCQPGLVLAVLSLGLLVGDGCQPAPQPTPSQVASTSPTSAPPSAKVLPVVAIDPPRLEVPAGMSAQYYASVPDGGPLPVAWSTGGLPPGVESQLYSQGSPYSRIGQIHTPGSLPAGDYTFEITAALGAQSSSQSDASQALIVETGQASLRVLPCREAVEPGSFTLLWEKDAQQVAISHTQFWRGLVSPVLLACANPTVRRLRVTVEAATSSAGARLDQPPHFGLYRHLNWPPSIFSIGGAVAESRDGVLDWEVVPGAYILYFPGEDLSGTSDAIPLEEAAKIAVTYRVELKNAP
jgi:hypothetical protein